MPEDMNFTVQCEECGRVKFDGLGESTFKEYTTALYYAGLHDGDNHPKSNKQVSTPQGRAQDAQRVEIEKPV